MVWTQPVVTPRFGNRPRSNGTNGGARADPSQAGHGPTDVFDSGSTETAGRGRMHTDSEVEADFALEALYGCLSGRGALDLWGIGDVGYKGL